ncbi:MAG: YdcF family protein, partial [Methylocystis sp.]
MFFTVAKTFEFFLSPVPLAIFLGVFGSTLLYTRWRMLGRALSSVSAFALLLMAFGPLGGLLAGPLEARFPPPAADMAPPDGAIVLGGAIDERLSADRDRPTL